MKERPILMSGPMVLAILEGRKTMTRRVNGLGEINAEQDFFDFLRCDDTGMFIFSHAVDGEIVKVRCPYGVPGDRLWVRETFKIESVSTHVPVYIPYEDVGIIYAADNSRKNIHRDYPSALSRACHNNRPSIFMPRWASRITLEITGVRVERLWEITEEDAVAEGVEPTREDPGHFNWKWYGLENTQCHARMSFETLWKMINGNVSWDANPWVWVVEFGRVKG